MGLIRAVRMAREATARRTPTMMKTVLQVWLMFLFWILRAWMFPREI
jgi:hypothetical protein